MASDCCADESSMALNSARTYRTVMEARDAQNLHSRRYALRAVLDAIDHFGCTTDEIRRACEVIDQET